MKEAKTVLSKALELNLNPQVYGAFAEIGAGQEVARFFFQAGKASQTIAKTISAYDMIYSDEIYGKESNGRYVCESRLHKMLDKEFNLLHRRLDATRGENTTFFAFANTVATGDQKKRMTHGWMGIRFQTKPGGLHNDIVLHVRLLDRHRLQQQETLGVLGVNLVYAAFYHLKKEKELIPHLVDGLKEGQVAIDLIRVCGPDVSHFSNDLLNLELVRRGLAECALFGPKGDILTISDELYSRAAIIQRGSYRPMTKTHLDVQTKGLEHFKKDFPEDANKALMMFEITMHGIDPLSHSKDQDYLDRIRSLNSMGQYVLISHFHLYYQMKQFLRSYTQKPMILIVGASHLDRLFDEAEYKDLDGGILEGLGKLLDNQTRIYVYPHKTENTCMTTKSFFPPQKILSVYQYFTSQGQIVDISGCDEIKEYVHSLDVQKLIQKKDLTWEKLVPAKVRDQIKKENLFGFLKKA